MKNRVDQELGIQEDAFQGEHNDEFYDKVEKIKSRQTLDRPKSSLTGLRPVSGRGVGPEQFFQ